MATCGRRGVSALTHDELRELALLYRQTAADLSTAREDRSSGGLTAHLNHLLGRAHNLLYAGRPAGRHGIVQFYTRTFPRVFRETWRYTAGATGLFLLGAAVGLGLVLSDSGFERFVLGPQMLDTIERRTMWTHSIVAVKPLASAGIMTNNLSVSFMACASGIFAGLGTAYMLAFNGLLFAVVAAACHRVGMSLSLWSFVAPHGSLELPAIFMAGGAGLVLAHAVAVAGLRPRHEAIVEAGRVALRLLLGVVPLLVIAGLVEGFVSPTAVPEPFKFLFGGALFVLLGAYLLSGHQDDQSAPRSLIAR
jgi:uncharacterized membrane protein SpoIIM required for sporulation